MTKPLRIPLTSNDGFSSLRTKLLITIKYNPGIALSELADLFEVSA